VITKVYLFIFTFILPFGIGRILTLKTDKQRCKSRLTLLEVGIGLRSVGKRITALERSTP